MKTIYIIFLVFLINSGCKKDKLPEETATGANTFGCKVDGQLYIPSGGDPGNGWYPVEGGWFLSGSDKGLYIRTVSGNTSFIDLYIKKLVGVGTYKLDINTQYFPNAVFAENYGYYAIKNNGNRSNFVTTATYTGSVNVMYISGGIIAGTFEFIAHNQQTGEKVTITEGRFDVKN